MGKEKINHKKVNRFEKRNLKCPKCGSYKWKTKIKNEAYECRNCGHINKLTN